MLCYGLRAQFIAVCLSGQSFGWWRMTLLRELHSHNLQQGLSISHVSRAIRIENVCEHPLCVLFLRYLRAQGLWAIHCPHFTLLQWRKKKNVQHSAVCNRWLRKETAGQRRRAARRSSVRRNLSVLGLCRLYSAIKEGWHTPPGPH